MKLIKVLLYPFKFIVSGFYNTYAFILIKRGKYDKAMNVLKKAAKLDIRHNLTYNNIAYIEFVHNKDLGAGEKALENAKKSRPNYFITLINYSFLYVKQEKYDEVFEILEKMNKSWYGRGLALNNKAVALIRQEKFDEALEVINKLIKKNKKSHLGLYNRGFILNKMGKTEEALKDIKKAAKLVKGYQYNYSLALTYLKNGQIEEAIKALNDFAIKQPFAYMFDEDIDEWNKLINKCSDEEKIKFEEIIAKLPVKSWKEL